MNGRSKTTYFLPFKQTDGTYLKGAQFDTVYQIYEFDRKLRHLLFGAIEVIEVCVRSILSNYHASKYGSLGYKDAANFKGKHNHEKFEENLEREILNNSKIPFVKYHLNKYGGQKAIAKDMGLNNRELASWLRCCTDLRNACAHYSRLYNRIFTFAPSGLNLSERERRRLWGEVFMLRSLYPSAEKWNTEFVPAIIALIDEYKADISFYHIAFLEDWEKRLLR